MMRPHRHRSCYVAPLLLLSVVAWLAPGRAAADFAFQSFKALVVEQEVTYRAEICEASLSSTTLAIYHHLNAAPTAATPPNQTKNVSAGVGCPPADVLWSKAPIGLYKSWAALDHASFLASHVAGPIEVCVGPDLVVKSFTIEINGASVVYKAVICNNGSMTARKFRLGFWHDRTAAPAKAEMGDVFKGIAELKPGVCSDELIVQGGLRPNGSFQAWCRIDSGDFVEECREANNTFDPLPYSLSNPDLEIAAFEAIVSGGTVTYNVKVCNKGTADVTKFYTDIYYHRPKLPPTIGEPGDVVKPTLNLAASACTTMSFIRPSTPKGTYSSYVFADPDDFISEPNEANNLSSPLTVQVGEASSPPPPGQGCIDNDKDGYGVGPDCKLPQDCNDSDPAIYPGAKEVCGDGKDNNCNFTVDDGCPGVDCVDKDGDGWGVGKDCVLADCDDSNKAIFPLGKEICGNGKDDNCDGIVDDGCPGRQCDDKDGDGYGVGKGCPGPPDCDDANFAVKPGAKEVCGDGLDNNCNNWTDEGCAVASDADGDGWAVGAVAPKQPDCNDSDRTIYPGAKEICGDGKDNNCNGTVDDGCPGVDCVDKDGDGWGVGKACKIQDCDDTNPAVHPWALEVCGDKIDNNCNGTVDDGCPGVDCVDKDGDGWGVGKGCKVQDCDDSDPAVNPWMPEICGDNKDNNCDGNIDEGCLLCEDKDGDGHGVGPKCATWDCDDGDPNVHPGAPEICNGKDDNCNGEVDEACVKEGGCGCRVPGAEPSPSPVAGSAGSPLPLIWLVAGLLLLGVVRRRR